MYGTIARMRMKPGTEQKMVDLVKDYGNRRVPGYVADYVYRMDEDPNVVMVAVVFKDRESYTANADSAEQNDFYQRMMEMVEGEPEWHDGEIIGQNSLTSA